MNSICLGSLRQQKHDLAFRICQRFELFYGKLCLVAPKLHLNGPKWHHIEPKLNLGAAKLHLEAAKHNLHAPKLNLVVPKQHLEAAKHNLNTPKLNLHTEKQSLRVPKYDRQVNLSGHINSKYVLFYTIY